MSPDRARPLPSVWGEPPPGLSREHTEPPVVVGSLDAAAPADPFALDRLPAGPFRSTDGFCTRWMVPQERAEAARQQQCNAGPKADECNSLGCGPMGYCNARALPARSSGAPGRTRGPASLGPFRDVELVTAASDGCAAPPCYLAITDARGTWLVHEILACSGGEGESAGVDTLALRVVDHQLVWRYAHHVRMGDVTEERVTVHCGAGPSGPQCTASTE